MNGIRFLASKMTQWIPQRI